MVIRKSVSQRKGNRNNTSSKPKVYRSKIVKNREKDPSARIRMFNEDVGEDLIRNYAVNPEGEVISVTLNRMDENVAERVSFLSLSFPDLERIHFEGIETGDDIPRLFSNLGSFTSLHELTIDRMYHVKELPDTISELDQLRTLEIGEQEILDISAIDGLEHLETMIITNGEVEKLPTEDAYLPSLEKVVLRNNGIKEFPNFFKGRGNVEVVDLSHNMIYRVPRLKDDMTNLKELNMENADISFTFHFDATMPETVQVLNISDNPDMDVMRHSITFREGLKKLDFSNTYVDSDAIDPDIQEHPTLTFRYENTPLEKEIEELRGIERRYGDDTEDYLKENDLYRLRNLSKIVDVL